MDALDAVSIAWAVWLAAGHVLAQRVGGWRARCVYAVGVVPLLGFVAGVAMASNSAHITCPTADANAAPTSIYFTPGAGTCATFTSWNGMNMSMCSSALIGATRFSGGTVDAPCTSVQSDDSIDTGIGHYYVNCTDCPRYTWGTNDTTKVRGNTVGLLMFQPSTAGGAAPCIASSIPVAGSFKCATSALYGCKLGALEMPCALGPVREPDMAQVVAELLNVENYGLVGLFALLFVLGFAWTYRSLAGFGGAQ